MEELLDIMLLLLLRDDIVELELLLVSEDVKEDDKNRLEELEDSSQRHSSVVSILAEKRCDVELREDDGDDSVEILDVKLLLDFELREDDGDDGDELETKEEEDVDDGDELETKEEEDVDVDNEVLEELDFDDELLDDITEDELDSFELLLSKLRDELLLLLVSEDEREVDSVDVNTLEELEESSQRHSSVVVMLTDEEGGMELREDSDDGDDGVDDDALLDLELMNFELDDGDELETIEEEDIDDDVLEINEDSDELETNEEEDVVDDDDDVLETKEELLEELDNFELLLFKLL